MKYWKSITYISALYTVSEISDLALDFEGKKRA